MKINNLGINFERYWNLTMKDSLSLKENAKILVIQSSELELPLSDKKTLLCF